MFVLNMVAPNFVLVLAQMVAKIPHFKRSLCLRSLKDCQRLMLWFGIVIPLLMMILSEVERFNYRKFFQRDTMILLGQFRPRVAGMGEKFGS